jgi:hypothetical protein
MINCLQILIHFPLFNIVYPANALGLYQVIAEAAGFESLPSGTILTKIFRFNRAADKAFNSKFDMLGYGGHNLILNLGTTFMIFVGGFTATLLL